MEVERSWLKTGPKMPAGSTTLSSVRPPWLSVKSHARLTHAPATGWWCGLDSRRSAAR
jgi:hypothetical protein